MASDNAHEFTVNNEQQIPPVHGPLPKAPQRRQLESGDTRATSTPINRKHSPTSSSAPTGRTPLPSERRLKINVGNTEEVVNPIKEDASANPVFSPIQIIQRAAQPSECFVVNKGNTLSSFTPINAPATKHVSQNSDHSETNINNTLDSPAVINKVHTSVPTRKKSSRQNKTLLSTNQDKCIELKSGVPYGASVTEEEWKHCLQSIFHLEENKFETQETRQGYTEDPGSKSNKQSWRVVSWRLINRSPKKLLTLNQIYHLGIAWCQKPDTEKAYNSCRHALTNAPELIQQHGCTEGWWYISAQEEHRELMEYDKEPEKRERKLARPRRKAQEQILPPTSRNSISSSIEGAKKPSDGGSREGLRHTADEGLRRHPTNTQHTPPSSSFNVLNSARNHSPRTNTSTLQSSVDLVRVMTKKRVLQPSVDIEITSEKQNDRDMKANPAKRQHTETSHKMSLDFVYDPSDRLVSLKYSADGTLLSTTDPESKTIFFKRIESNSHDTTTDTASDPAYRWVDPEDKKFSFDEEGLEAAASLMVMSRAWNSGLRQDAEEVPTKRPSPHDSGYTTSPSDGGKMVKGESHELSLCSQATRR